MRAIVGWPANGVFMGCFFLAVHFASEAMTKAGFLVFALDHADGVKGDAVLFDLKMQMRVFR